MVIHISVSIYSARGQTCESS